MFGVVLFSATFACCVAYAEGYDIREDFKSRMEWLGKNFKQERKLAQDDSDDSKRMKWPAKKSKQGRKLAQDDLERDESSSESNASLRNREEKHKEEVQSLMTELETAQTKLATMQTEVGELRGQVNMLFSSLQNKGFNFPPAKSRGSSRS